MKQLHSMPHFNSPVAVTHLPPNLYLTLTHLYAISNALKICKSRGR